MNIKILNIESLLNWHNLIYAMLFLVLSFAYLYFAGYLKKYQKIKTSYTRKIFHLLIFVTAVIIDLNSDLVYIFGCMASIVICYAIYMREGNILYEALARESDAPNRTYYVIVPFLTTVIGGVASSLIFPQTAFIGYLVLGLGDAMGEIVGTYFGKNKYQVLWFGQVSQRSCEGSAAVFVTCLITIVIGVVASPFLVINVYSAFTIPLLALTCTLIEAWSPHGWDNVALQIVPAFLIGLM